MREYAARSGAIVIGVDYSLSPEARFPQALNEVAGAVAWLSEEGARLGVDASRLALGGDSAGANLAVSSCLKLKAQGQAAGVRGLLCNYGFFDADLSTPSQRRYGEPGAFLSSEELDAYLVNYLGEGDPRTDPLALPILADLSDLPPSFHVIAECDPLCDGDLLMAERMARAGNRVSQTVYGGATESADWLRDILFPSAA
jgi:acetyl esterase